MGKFVIFGRLSDYIGHEKISVDHILIKVAFFTCGIYNVYT